MVCVGGGLVRGPCRVGMQWGVRGLFGEGGRVGGGGGVSCDRTFRGLHSVLLWTPKVVEVQMVFGFGYPRATKQTNQIWVLVRLIFFKT
jgi:hypothetical protein